MPIFDVGGFGDVAAAWDEVEKLEAPAQDIRKLIEARGPSDDEITAARLISSWFPVESQILAVLGKTTSHPILVGRRRITTSPSAVIDAEASWIRTRSSFYRLGDALGSDDRTAEADQP